MAQALSVARTQLVGAAHKRMAIRGVTKGRKRLALAIAGIADLVQLGFFPVFGEGALSIPDDALDLVVGGLLLLTLGFSWRVLASLAIELVPGAALFPTWTAMVATLPTLPEVTVTVAQPPALPG